MKHMYIYIYVLHVVTNTQAPPSSPYKALVQRADPSAAPHLLVPHCKLVVEARFRMGTHVGTSQLAMHLSTSCTWWPVDRTGIDRCFSWCLEQLLSQLALFDWGCQVSLTDYVHPADCLRCKSAAEDSAEDDYFWRGIKILMKGHPCNWSDLIFLLVLIGHITLWQAVYPMSNFGSCHRHESCFCREHLTTWWLWVIGRISFPARFTIRPTGGLLVATLEPDTIYIYLKCSHLPSLMLGWRFVCELDNPRPHALRRLGVSFRRVWVCCGPEGLGALISWQATKSIGTCERCTAGELTWLVGESTLFLSWWLSWSSLNELVNSHFSPTLVI